MSHNTNKDDMQVAVQRAEAVKEAHLDELMAKDNVVGVGVGFRYKDGIRTNEVGLVVMVSTKMSLTQLEPETLIPQSIDGVPVDVQEVGQIRAQ